MNLIAREIAYQIDESRRAAEENAEFADLAEMSENAKVTLTARVSEHTLFLLDCLAAESSSTRSALAADLVRNGVTEAYAELAVGGYVKPFNDPTVLERYVKWLEERRS
jgi:hypothetical protein